mmetsp:Transcript_5296/g.19796  ORF Transcript_5296/g.19796 Transcript_5296/m.19796 type:complete len:94 (-) Transcript_5296:2509-2790(-)
MQVSCGLALERALILRASKVMRQCSCVGHQRREFERAEFAKASPPSTSQARFELRCPPSLDCSHTTTSNNTQLSFVRFLILSIPNTINLFHFH